MNEVILYGNSTLSQMVLSDASGSDFKIVAFAVDRDYLNATTCCGLPQVDFEDVENMYPPDRYDMLAVLGAIAICGLESHTIKKARAKGLSDAQLHQSGGQIVPIQSLLARTISSLAQRISGSTARWGTITSFDRTSISGTTLTSVIIALSGQDATSLGAAQSQTPAISR